MASEKYVNNAVTTLNGAINNSTTTVVVTSAATFPATGDFRIAVGGEIMLVTGVSSNTFTVTRGAESSTADSHADLDPVTHVLTKGSLDGILADNCQYGTCANRPAAERAGRLYIGSDFPMFYRDNGSTWDAFYRNSPAIPPTTGNYTWTHGGPTATNTDITNGPTLLHVLSTGGGDKISKFVKSVSPPWTFTTRTIPCTYNPNIAYTGCCVSDGTKLELFGIIYEGNVPRLWLPRFNSLTSYAGDQINRMEPSTNLSDMWLQVVDDNTNRIYSYSSDGVNYVTLYTVSRTTFLTATEVGLYVGTNAGSGNVAQILWVSDGI